MGITWNPDVFLVGVELMDTQHKELFDILNDIYMHYSQLNQDDKKSKETLEQYFTFFLNYTIKHFSEEEELYKRVGYKELENHKRLHSRFIKDIDDIVQDYKQGKPIKKVMLNLYSKGYKWLCEHITIADVHASKWIKSQQH